MHAAQIRAARALVNISQAELALKAGVSVPTIKRLEGMSGILRVRLTTIHAIREALQLEGVEFIPENGGGVGVRLKERGNDGEGKN